MHVSKTIFALPAALVVAGALTYVFAGNEEKADDSVWFDRAVAVAAAQLSHTADAIDTTGAFPRSLMTDYSLEQLVEQMEIPHTDFKPEIELLQHPSVDEYRTLRLCSAADWTAGFFPGSLWLAYELTADTTLRDRAVRYTNRMLPASYMTDTHDLGFMINCSYGQALRLAPADSIREVIVRTADNLISRFDPTIGCIRSWDFGPWNYPVIIDNMMNLQLLFNASKISGDAKYKDVAIKHARTTLAHHFRPDHTCYHVVSYNADGTVQSAGTFQGKSDGSAWARGQGWALYGYTETYRETGIKEFLDKAIAVADMFIERNNTDDRVPYWDLDAHAGTDTPRDASAAALIASGLIELGYITSDARYTNYAEQLIRNLASPAYLAEQGTNAGFVLMHSVGSLPHGSEIDTPLNYADYYFLEALVRLARVKKGEAPVAEFIS